MKFFRYALNPEKVGSEKLVFTNANSEILSALKGTSTKVAPIIPDATQYIRDMNKYGLVGMGLRRVVRLGPAKLFKLGLFAMPRGWKVFKKDFRKLVEVLLYVELLDFQKHNPKVVFLHPQITDLALANNNTEVLTLFAKLVRKMGSEPGIATKNVGHLLEKLSSLDLGVEYILTPINKKGYMMRPSKRGCEKLIKANKEFAFFSDFSVPGISRTVDIEYLKKLGVKAVVY